MNKNYYFIFLIIGFMGACSRKTDNYSYGNNHSVKIEESEVVLSRFPSQIEEINDSVIATVNSYRQLSMYNIHSGKNIHNFSTDHINFDSLIQSTFQKKYVNEKKYVYDSNYAGFGEGNAHMSSFYYTDGNFYIHVRTMAEVTYLKDSSELEAYAQNEQISRLKKAYGKVRLKMTDYLGFLFVTDDKLKLQKIIPLYGMDILKKNNYIPLFERAFMIKNNHAYVFLLQSNESYQNMRSMKQAQPYYIAKLDLENEKNVEYLLTNAQIDYKGFSINDYFASHTKFQNKGDKIFYTNGKEICELLSGKKVFSRKALAPNEWIGSFYIEGDKIIMANYNKDKRKHVGEFEKQYAVDSVNSFRVKVFNTATATWSKDKKLKEDAHLPVLISKNKIIYFDKDKQNYYLKYVPIYEN